MAVERETDPSPAGPTPGGHSPPWTMRQLAAGFTLFVGLGHAVAGFGHLHGVAATAQVRGYAYYFRFAGLLLVGITIAYAGVLCVWAVPRLARGQRRGWDRALSGTLLLLLVSVPLIPVDGPGRDNAVSTAIPAAVELVLLLVVRRQLEPG